MQSPELERVHPSPSASDPEAVPGNFTMEYTTSEAARQESLQSLLGALVERAESDPDQFSEHNVVRLASRLGDRIRDALEVHLNRYSIRRQSDLFAMYRVMLDGAAGSTFDPGLVLDLGCGSENPLAMAFLMIACGARRAYGVDLCTQLDPARDTRFLAQVACTALIDPDRVLPGADMRPEQVWANLQGFDLAAASRGRSDAFPADRFGFLRESAAEMPFDDGEAGLILSNTFFEHVPDPAAVIAELARVTKPGGIGLHNIDCADHRSYGDPELSPLAFLTADETLDLVAESNRLRPFEFPPLFEAAGFEILRTQLGVTHDATAEEIETFQPRFRAMPPERLAELQILLTVRKR